MIRRTALRLAFSAKPLTKKGFIDPWSHLSFDKIVMQLGEILAQPQATLLLRSEPQSGKTSLLHYLEAKCTVFVEGKISASGLPLVDVKKSKAAAKKFGLGNHIVRYFDASQSANWLPWAREINRTKDAECTVLLIDEANLMFGDTHFGDFFKSNYEGKVLFVATTSAATTVQAVTPFAIGQYYMEPAFAERNNLVKWFRHNLLLGWESASAPLSGSSTVPPFRNWVDHVANTAVSICSGRVGIANYVGSELVSTYSAKAFFELFANRKDHEIVQAVNATLFTALEGTRLLKNWQWSAAQQCVVAAAMLEGALRNEIFNPTNSEHRKLFSGGGLRLAPVNSANLSSRYETTREGLVRIEDNPRRYALTAVAPMGYVSNFHKGIFSRYDGVVDKMTLMPVKVEDASNGLELVLRCLPHMDVKGLLCGDPVPGAPLRKSNTFLKGSWFPREIGGFQDCFRRAVEQVFGPKLVHVPQEKGGGNVDLLVQFKDSGAVCGVEMLIENQAKQLHHQISIHHDRWLKVNTHKNYHDNRVGGVTVAFVSNVDEVVNNTADATWIRDIPLLLVEFSHCVFSWRCRLLHEGQDMTFTLDLDGVAMKLVESSCGKELKPAQKIIGSVSQIEQLCNTHSTESRFKVWVSNRSTGQLKKLSQNDPWIAATVLQALNLDCNRWCLLAPDRFCHMKKLALDAQVPLTASDCPVEIVEVLAQL